MAFMIFIFEISSDLIQVSEKLLYQPPWLSKLITYTYFPSSKKLLRSWKLKHKTVWQGMNFVCVHSVPDIDIRSEDAVVNDQG